MSFATMNRLLLRLVFDSIFRYVFISLFVNRTHANDYSSLHTGIVTPKRFRRYPSPESIAQNAFPNRNRPRVTILLLCRVCVTPTYFSVPIGIYIIFYTIFYTPHNPTKIEIKYLSLTPESL